MAFDTWLLYLGTILIFMSTPGPSHLLMISVSMSNGFSRSLATAAGDLSANAIQIVLAGAGLATLVINSQYGFSIIKWLGVAYLMWMGAQKIRSAISDSQTIVDAPAVSLKNLWLKGFVTSAANPKAVVFFAALFPQFIEQDIALVPQILILGSTYIVVDGLFLCTYGKSASWLANHLTKRYKRWINYLAGAGLIGAAVMLGFKNNQTN